MLTARSSPRRVMTPPPVPEPSPVSLLTRGRNALAAGAWDEARRSLEAAAAAGDDPEALEGLGLAAWWLDLATLVFDAREQAFRLYRDRGETRAAARVAVWLGWDYGAFRGEAVVARGWFALARQLLANETDSPEFAWLSIREAVAALFEEGDPDGARRHAGEAASAARAAGSRDFELLAIAVDGLARVSAGEVTDGMRQLDGVSAAIIAGDMSDRVAIGLAGCYLIAACDRAPLRSRRPVVRADQGVLREVGDASALRRVPHAVRRRVSVARAVGRSRARAGRGRWRAGGSQAGHERRGRGSPG